MGIGVDYELCRKILNETFEAAEVDFREGKRPKLASIDPKSIELLFTSKTQAFREALVGCCLARITDSRIDVRKPYMNQGDDAYNARTLDEVVVNPFWHEREIPASRSPFLSAFRRNIAFVPETAKGLRDKAGYAAFLELVQYLRKSDDKNARELLRALLFSFVALRDKSTIRLSRIRRLDADQYKKLIGALLQVPSGGLLPVVLVVAAFTALKESFNLPWDIEWQGINVADSAKGVGGDITIKREGDTFLAIEVTERPVDKSRVRSTFLTKISRNRIDDYLFFHSTAEPTEEAREIARSYFAQGHEITFVEIANWIVSILAALGPAGRSVFTDTMVDLLEKTEVPSNIKVAWNTIVQKLVG